MIPLKENKRRSCEYQNSINLQLQQKAVLPSQIMNDLQNPNTTGMSTYLFILVLNIF